MEDLIKSRIAAERWDDVKLKQAAMDSASTTEMHLSQEKSKEGLGEIYGKAFLKTNPYASERLDKGTDENGEIQLLYDSLCWKLDALSNFHFTPKPLVRAIDVTTSVPAISMEDVSHVFYMRS